MAPNAPQAALGMIFFTFSAAAALTVWVLRRTDPLTTAIGGCLSVLPTAVLTLSGLHGAGLPTVYGGAALAGAAFGAVSRGVLRTLLDSLDEQHRAATLRHPALRAQDHLARLRRHRRTPRCSGPHRARRVTSPN
ncbi:hypothetical protein AB7952_04905 [Streptomyces sp. PG2]